VRALREPHVAIVPAKSRVIRLLSTRERKYDDVSYSNGVLASVTTRNKEEEMPVQKYVIELMGQSTKGERFDLLPKPLKV